MIQAQLWYLSIFSCWKNLLLSGTSWAPTGSGRAVRWAPGYRNRTSCYGTQRYGWNVCLRSLESLSVLWIRNVIYSGSGSTPYPFYLSIFGYYLNKKTLSSIKKRIYQLYAVFQLTLQYYIQSRMHRPKIKNTIFIYLLFHFCWIRNK